MTGGRLVSARDERHWSDDDPTGLYASDADTEELRDVVRDIAPDDARLDDDRVRRLAYRYYVERGEQDGRADEDWFRAERDLRPDA
jgi:hypothetical protein